MRHDETWKLETEPRQDVQVSRLSQDRDMKNHVSGQDTCLETPSLPKIVTLVSGGLRPG